MNIQYYQKHASCSNFVNAHAEQVGLGLSAAIVIKQSINQSIRTVSNSFVYCRYKSLIKKYGRGAPVFHRVEHVPLIKEILLIYLAPK